MVYRTTSMRENGDGTVTYTTTCHCDSYPLIDEFYPNLTKVERYKLGVLLDHLPEDDRIEMAPSRLRAVRRYIQKNFPSHPEYISEEAA